MAITISTIDDLEAFLNGNLGTGDSSNYLDVALSNDLDFSKLDDSDSRKWNFEGCTISSSTNFYINFNGNGYKIKNLNYNGTRQWCFLPNVYGTIKNLKFEDVNLLTTFATYSNYFLCVRLYGSVENVHLRGFFTAKEMAMIGYMSNTSSVDRCSMSGEFHGMNGIARSSGSGTYPLISRCYVAGDVYEDNISLLGNHVRIANSFFRGNIYPTTGTNVYWCINPPTSHVADYCYAKIYNITELVGEIASGAFFSSSQSDVTASYWSNDLAEGQTIWSDTFNSASSEELQNASWLRSKGWPI